MECAEHANGLHVGQAWHEDGGDGRNDYAGVEHVPPRLEVRLGGGVEAEDEDLEQQLGGEEDDEEDVTEGEDLA